MADLPVSEAAGAIWSHIPGYKDIVGKSQFEGGPSAKAIGRFFSGFANEGMKNAKEQLLRGTTKNKRDFGRQEIDPQHWYDFFGNLHAAEEALPF